MQLTGLADRLALVTGAGSGIGAAVARLLHEAGATVVATDVSGMGLAAAFDHTPGIRTELLDVSDSAAVESLVERLEQEAGPIELGINVAGVLSNELVTATTDAEWHRVFAVNTHGVFHVSRALARRMVPRRRGNLVTVSSNAAGIPRHAMAAYAASKAAATMFTRCLGLELAGHGIRCNIVAPGSTRTPMQTGMWSDAAGGERVIAGFPDIYKTGIPLQRLAEPEDVAHAVLFLLSDQSRHITMSDLYVDGGATLKG